MNPLQAVAAPSSVLAAVSTFHVALALIRKHRSADPGRALLLGGLSLLFALAPWVFSAPRDLAVGGGASIIWFAISSTLGGQKPVKVAKPAPKAAAPAPRPAAPAAAPAPAVVQAAAPSAPPAPPKPKGYIPTPVVALFDETPDIRTFRFVRPAGFDFRPGQFVTVQLQLEGKPVTRCYSISSSPESSGYMEISVKKQGLVSGLLFSAVKPGFMLQVRAPAGGFSYPEGDDRPLILVSGGVGCTPMMSMLRHAVASEPARPVVYLFAGKTEADIVFRHELALIGKRHPQARVVIALTRGTGAPQFYAGRIDEKLVKQVVPDPQQSLYYICGPGPMISGTKEMLAGMGVPVAQVRSEAFEAAVASAKAPVPDEPAEVPAAVSRPAAPAPAAPAPAAQGSGCAVRLAVSGKTVTVASGQSLLEAAETVQVEIPSMCRAGVCGACKTRVVSGDVECTADIMDDSDREAGYTFPCVAWAKGDCVLEA